ncbi:unnamed protein product [Durusdinium trenchii]|uniref:Uncharacterized protein n=2 Tax=Durusdinium trenchii TaxID=1381693 RepID=A0ABP0IX30_9DINO
MQDEAGVRPEFPRWNQICIIPCLDNCGCSIDCTSLLRAGWTRKQLGPGRRTKDDLPLIAQISCVQCEAWSAEKSKSLKPIHLGRSAYVPSEVPSHRLPRFGFDPGQRRACLLRPDREPLDGGIGDSHWDLSGRVKASSSRRKSRRRCRVSSAGSMVYGHGSNSCVQAGQELPALLQQFVSISEDEIHLKKPISNVCFAIQTWHLSRAGRFVTV